MNPQRTGIAATATPKPIPFLAGLGDAEGMNRPEYYSTLRCADVDGDGRDELLMRGPEGMVVWGLSAGNVWTPWPIGPIWSDSGNWVRPEYYSTIQCADVDGDGRAELLARGWGGITLYRCDPVTHTWQALPSGPALGDSFGWARPEYYSTIQCADIDGDGCAELLARGGNGVSVFKLNLGAQTWTELSRLDALSDANGWNRPEYYSTIQCADIDGNGRAELIARGPSGIVLFSYDPAAQAWKTLPHGPWKTLPQGPAFSDAFGWNRPEYYSTIQCADLDGDGCAELLGRGSNGISAFKLNLDTQTWTELPLVGEFADRGNWAQPEYYRTIQTADIDGDGQAELLGRGGVGMVSFKYDMDGKRWVRLPNGAAWDDGSSWNRPEYYSTIQSADLDGDGRRELVARGGSFVQIWQQPEQPYSGRWAIMNQGGSWFRVDPVRPCGIGMSQQVGPAETIMIVPQGADAQGRPLVRLVSQPGVAALAVPGASEPQLRAGVVAMVEEAQLGYNLFSLADPRDADRWLSYDNNGTYFWGAAHDQRAIFARAVKLADDAAQVGRLVAGEAVFYEHENYSGRAWVFHAQHADFGSFKGLNEQVSSLRLGPLTGLTVYLDSGFGGTREDIVRDTPVLTESQVGDNAISSFRIWCNLSPSDVGISATSKLGQDYRPVTRREPSVMESFFGHTREMKRARRKHEEEQARRRQGLPPVNTKSAVTYESFSAYRTIIQLPPEVTQVEVWANDDAEISVAGKTYSINEDQSATLAPNSTHRIMIVSAARGIHTPGLKLRTNTMASFQRCMIYPDRESHEKLNGLEQGALYNATGSDQRPLINRQAVDPKTAAAAQTAIQRVVATVRYTNGRRRVSATAFRNSPWALNFAPQAPTATTGGASNIVAGREFRLNDDGSETELNPQPAHSARPGPAAAAFQELSSADVARFLASADFQVEPLAQGFLDFFTETVAPAIKDAKKIFVVAGAAIKQGLEQGVKLIKEGAKKIDEAFTVLIEYVSEGVTKALAWVVDSAQKVGAFVKGVVEKLGVAMGRFVEWLQSLFDWGDIIATQRYLRSCINSGLDYLKRQVKAAKPHVAGFFDRQNAKVKAELDKLIAQLGGLPNPQQRQASPPEAFEWLLARLGDNAEGASGYQASPSGELGASFTALIGKYGEVATTFGGQTEQLTDAIALLVSDPKAALATLLGIVKELFGAVMVATRDTVLLLLDLVAAVIDLVKDAINRPLTIPFISDFYSSVLAGGEPLTIANLATLMLAIPITVIGKLKHGRRPFASAGALALATDARIAQDWAIAKSVCGFAKGMLASILDPIPETDAPSFLWMFEGLGLVISGFAWLGSFPGGSPQTISFAATEDKEIWEITLWSFGTFMLGLDMVAFVSGNVESFKRANKVTTITTTVLSSVGLVLSIAAAAHSGKSVATGFADGFDALPGIAAFARVESVVKASKGTSLLALGLVDRLAAVGGLAAASAS